MSYWLAKLERVPACQCRAPLGMNTRFESLYTSEDHSDDRQI